MNKSQIVTIAVYPQPANEKVTIKLPAELDQKNVVVNIINSAGGLEKQLTSTGTRTNNTIVLRVDQMAKGVYFIRIHSGDKIFVSPLVVE